MIKMKILIAITGFLFLAVFGNAQKALFKFGNEVGLEKVISGNKAKGDPIQWIQVNTMDSTWKNVK